MPLRVTLSLSVMAQVPANGPARCRGHRRQVVAGPDDHPALRRAIISRGGVGERQAYVIYQSCGVASGCFAITEYLRGAAPASPPRRWRSASASPCAPSTATSTACATPSCRCAAERGRGGGYALDRAYTLPPVNFTPREAALLVTLGGWATRDAPPAVRRHARRRARQGARRALGARRSASCIELMDGIQFVGVPGARGAAGGAARRRAGVVRAPAAAHPLPRRRRRGHHARGAHRLGGDGAQRDAAQLRRPRQGRAAAVPPRPHPGRSRRSSEQT